MKDDGSIIIDNKTFLEGPTMSELYVIQCPDLKGSKPETVHHVGLDWSFGDHCSGTAVQKFGTNGWKETRTKILSIRNLTFQDGFLHIIIKVLEYK